MMSSARFCSECGERLEVKRRAVIPLRAFCARCSPRFRTVRLVSAAILVFAIIAFAASRLSPEREPFYLIGTPMESSANLGASASPGSIDPPRASAQMAVEPVIGTCGAPTRSGKPCQRKVKGGGYCWQHRDKSVGRGFAQRK